MKIGINLLYLQPGVVGGTETYISELIAEFTRVSDEQIILFCNFEAAQIFEETTSLKIVQVSKKPFRQIDRLLNENLYFNEILFRYPVDVLFSPSGIAAPFLLRGIPQVCTAHDLQHLHLSTNFSWVRRMARTILYAASYWRCSHIIAISEFTRRDVINCFNIMEEKITTIHHGAGNEFIQIDKNEKASVRVKFDLPDRFFYYPAAMHRHKNHLALVNYFAKLQPMLSEKIHMIFTGAKSELYYSVQDEIRKLGLEKCVHHLGYVNRREVLSLLTMAEAMVFPSLFEGFGLPILEAMKCGTPVIAANTTSLPEIAGEAAILLDPYDCQGWTQAMLTIAKNDIVRKDLIEKGHKNVNHFSWRKCAEETLQVLQLAANKERSINS